MTKTVKIALISVGSVAATAVVSSLSYIKGKKDGMLLMQKQHESTLNAAPERSKASQPHA